MHAALGDILFAFVEKDHLWLSPTYHLQKQWWSVVLDRKRLHHQGALEYGQALCAAYLQAHPEEVHRVGQHQILSVLLRALDTIR
ncbi:hypothetical protein [Hymenobacter crusticola]|uniref:Uncharacterized protein n=1 Tax=Hymenobacter crusticola TaxID=1770526 RepID=A0A2C9ZTT7_9BACT|nr:hypothetical protein [Hymenobacter crusticola]OUJ67743.1 hypothetical protein BXP70_28655 [Hymenobacter crusticola]